MTDIVLGASIEGDVACALYSADLVVTDEVVAGLYPDLCENAFVIPAGEDAKSRDVLFSILEQMYDKGLTRGGRIAALGGGTVGDVTGLAAALYMRGIEWINVPTTLLAQADAGIGGKTAIDMFGVKNLIGAFHKPKKTIISYEFLNTLAERERLSGAGELIKTCLLRADDYSYLLAHAGELTAFVREGAKAGGGRALIPLIERAVEIKRAAVKRDPKEKGLRAVLNVGHTVGHALESADGCTLSHGEYVLKGIMTELAMFDELVCRSFAFSVTALCKEYTSPPRTTARPIAERAARDKKNDGDGITVMLPVGAGDIVRLVVSPDEFIERYDRAIKQLRKE